jgi:hypothetical protein
MGEVEVVADPDLAVEVLGGLVVGAGTPVLEVLEQRVPEQTQVTQVMLALQEVPETPEILVILDLLGLRAGPPQYL